MRRFSKFSCVIVPLLAIGACHSSHLVGASGSLLFSSPDQPVAVQQLDAGLVEIDFGQVAVSSTKTLTLSALSINGAGVTLGALTQLQPDSEFSLPFVPGTVVEPSVSSDITASFSPGSLGTKTATYSLAYTPPSGGTLIIQLTGQGVPSGLNVTPNPVDFGNVELNQLQPVSLTITNNTEVSASLTLSGIQGPNANEFSLGALSSTSLAPNASATLSATFGPLVTGPANSTLTIAGAIIGETSSPTSVSLVGTGVQSWLQVTSPLDFGYLPPGETLVKSAVLSNAGSFTTLHLIVPAPSITQPGMSVFALSSPQPVPPLAIAPGQSVPIPVSFAPPSSGSYAGTLSLASDDPGSPTPVIQLTGHGGGPQILCISPLDFGPVPLGYSGSLKTVCVNTGTDIPGDPDGGLQIAQASLGIDNQAFVATMTLADGGLAGPGFSVSLAPGQSEAIDVTFRPDDAGLTRGRLLIPSNDPGDPDAGVALTGEGIVPGPCSISLIPRQLDLGEVPSGDTSLLPFEIANTGQNLCLLTGVSLDPTSDPAFSLPGGNLAYQLLSFPGDPDNAAGLPSSLWVDVQFAPTAAESATGSVDVSISNASPVDQSVSLVASSIATCLSVEPQTEDFGVVGFSPSDHEICAPDKRTFAALNECTVPVTITAIDISSGADPIAQFSLDSALQLPLVIAPGGSAYFQASFAPSAVGPKTGSITVSTSELPTPFVLMLKGDAETTGSRTDTFTGAPPDKQLDILWILDVDDDLLPIADVAKELPQFVNFLDNAQIDYHIVVTTSETCDAGSSDQGSFEPCEHCRATTSPDPMIITPSTAAPGTALSDRFGFIANDLVDYDCTYPENNGVCLSLVCHNGDEHFFDTIADAFSPALLAGHNAGFLRPDAGLAVIVVNGDDEDDSFGNAPFPPVPYFGDGPWVTSLDQVLAVLQGLKADPSMVSVSYIDQGGGFGLGQPRMEGLVDATGGAEAETDLADWETTLLDLIPFTGGFVEFHLSSVPVGQPTVSIDGVQTHAWSYNASLNDVVFPTDGGPPPGSTITVTYDVGCQ